MIDVNLLLSIRPSDGPLRLPSLSECSSGEEEAETQGEGDEQLEGREAEEIMSLERIRRLRETILAVDEPRKLFGTIAEAPSSGKIPEFKFIHFFRSRDLHPHRPPWFDWVDDSELEHNNLENITLDCIPDDLLQAEQWSRNRRVLPPKSHDPILPSPDSPAHAIHSKSPSNDKNLECPPQQERDQTLRTHNENDQETDQLDEVRYDTMNAGLGLSECGLFQSQLQESYDLEDITKFVTTEDQDYQSQF
ncbi:hypothetical protein MJO28_006825 [Puccinia striiformis f. sp. tritici]|uniref:Uncharacterized protein n=3 Tax=Puccinia striiformis TaxID=27350 RepID=A0A0L0UTH0_9BASI|nr:hypothetical protein Pst134EA_012002 [Puccinia striiformis f. sp. tritici]KAI9619425.1 hypothetical protein H4Q26_014187 [Puccinia striiformis f. sp. tritici PST-130]KNE90019.1 hypothetical protein PSTG_16536 [Puccinia striiformis f. sp. tritici PST-78]POW09927.1 hypothetical protein PSHT_08921 [Puccinia striiformis]KAH9456758.1 hypothetical protein Pst134EB_012960 [Puccinia striiformis f. sp. tritici]KAH9468379.1 hypothetical protein Pst134EA_012002 [Puccinia striiformis f. sp. tritici]